MIQNKNISFYHIPGPRKEDATHKKYCCFELQLKERNNINKSFLQNL